MYNGQFNQDRWVDDTLEQKTHGLFLDIGGCRPVKTNNTYFFEKERDWTGVIVEANRDLIENIEKERKALVMNNAIWHEDYEKAIFYALENHYSLSTAVYPEDEHQLKRETDNTIMHIVPTITISKIFDMMGWEEIDYMSIDVEGSELQALRGMDHEKHSARCVTIEHNGIESQREQMYRMLVPNGYRRLSAEEREKYYDKDNDQHRRWFWYEDWYVRR